MQQPESLQLVAEFHKTFHHPILSEPTIPSEARCNLRVSLITEELKELEAAIKDKDIVEIADALCDIRQPRCLPAPHRRRRYTICFRLFL